jgi:histidyl-tRNA synthetase
MANKTKFQAIKGTRDLLPPETELWNRVEQTAREVFGSFGFGEIRLPIFEQTELFARAVGGETDIISKEMYSFEDHDFPELARFRTVLSSRTLASGDPKRFHEFMAEVKDFLGDLGLKIEQKSVPRVSENENALAMIPRLLEESRYCQVELASSAHPIVLRSELSAKLTRALENIRTLLRGVHFGDQVSLRPEATASVCRAYIEHGMQALAQPVKLYYMGPMFRRERPQKGRYRQFYQIGAEVLETVRKEVASGEWLVASQKEAATDAEVIEMVMAFFAKLGLEGVQLEINSIGHSEPPVDSKNVCRRAYVEKLKAALETVKGQLGEDSKRRIETNPLRVLDSKLESEQAIIEKLPRIGDNLCADCAKHYVEVKRQLELRGVAYQENWRLVRGLDYYMRTTFEITARGLGSQNAVCGGGRYDGLVELLGGPPTKGIGFAIGEDRVILSLQEAKKEVASGKWLVASGKSGCDVYVAWMGKSAEATAIRAARDLRDAGFRVELPPVEQKFGKALGQADKLGARYALILGEDEVASGQWTLKTLADGTQGKYSEAGLMEFLRKQKS